MSKQPSQRDPEEQAFLDAIADEPDDETHRLVFGDWLEDRDDPRASWVRDADIWARMAPDAGDPIPRLLEALGAKQGVRKAKKARGVLLRMGSGASTAVREWVQAEPDERWEAAKPLLEMEPTELRSVDELRKSLQSDDWYSIWQAASDLGFHGAAAAEAIRELMNPPEHEKWDEFQDWDPENPLWETIHNTLGKIGPAAKAVGPDLASVVWHSESAAEALLKIRPDPLVVLDNLNTSDYWEVLDGVRLIAMLDPTKTGTLIHAIRTQTGRIRDAAATVLGEMRVAEAVPTIIEVLRTNKEWDRDDAVCYLVESLAEIGEPAKIAVPVLRELLEEYRTIDHRDELYARNAVGISLARLGHPAEAAVAVFPGLEEKQEFERSWTARALGLIALRSTEIDEFLSESLEARTATTRKGVIAAISKAIEGDDGDYRDLATCEVFVEPIVGALKDRAKAVREAAVSALCQFGLRWERTPKGLSATSRTTIIDTLLDIVGNDNCAQEIRQAAVSALSHWGDLGPSAREPLARWLEQHDDEEARTILVRIDEE